MIRQKKLRITKIFFGSIRLNISQLIIANLEINLKYFINFLLETINILVALLGKNVRGGNLIKIYVNKILQFVPGGFAFLFFSYKL